MVHMGNLFCCICFLYDNVVTMVLQGADDTQLVVARVWELVSISGLALFLHFHHAIFLAGDQLI